MDQRIVLLAFVSSELMYVVITIQEHLATWGLLVERSPLHSLKPLANSGLPTLNAKPMKCSNLQHFEYCVIFHNNKVINTHAWLTCEASQEVWQGHQIAPNEDKVTMRRKLLQISKEL